MSKIIGIDLGTGFSAVSVFENGVPKVITSSDGNLTTPSIVAFTDDGKLVGNAAKRQATTNPERTIYEAKRLIGRMYKDKEVQDFAKIAPFKLKSGAAGEVLIEVDGKDVSPVEISAAVLSEMKKYAEEYLGEEVTDAVVTVPAYFTDGQRQATKDAGKIAGLNVLRILNEPTAASLLYHKDNTKEEKVIVVDVGAGTSDISILELGGGVVEVLGTKGDMFLGGTDFDQVVVNWVADEFKKTDGIDLRTDKMALQRLKDVAEEAKKALSGTAEADINLPFITASADGPRHLNMKLSKAKFENMISPLVEKILVLCKTVLNEAKLTVTDIDEVILAGGSTRVPAVQKIVEDFFGKKADKSISPDLAISEGAAIQASILIGETTDVLLLDITPLSLSIETLGGLATRLIEKNTTIPTSKTQTFSTASDGQTAVSIVVVQGERQLAKDNKVLGKFDLTDIPIAARGVPQIFVSFDVDANGILKVSAKDLGTGKEQSITITSSSGISKEEIERMVHEAEENAEADKAKKELIELRNQAEGLIFSAEKTMKDNGEKIPEETKTLVTKATEDLRNNLTSENKEVIIDYIENLNREIQKVSEILYAQAPPPPPPEDQAQQTAGADEDVIDAEYKEAV